MSTVTTAPRQLLRRDERRAQILRAAAQAFSRDGFAATSIDEVAKQAGITKLIVYRHFDSKSDLYRAVLSAATDRLAEEWVEVTADPHAVAPGIRAMLTVAREMPDGFRLLYLHAVREQEFAPYAEEFQALQEALVDRDVVPAAIPAGPRRSWAARIVVRYSVVSVIEWVELGDPDDDDGFHRRAAAGLRGMVAALAADESASV